MENSAIEKRFSAVARSRTFKHIIATYTLDTKSVLDIGCSYGEHLSHFGPGSTGLTISAEEAQYGTQKGLDIREGNIEEGFDSGATYDAIYSSNLLEHLYSPHDFLFKARNYLKEDGVLVLGVPCVPFPSFLMRIKKFRGALATNHINFFTGTTLRLTAERAGWRVRTVRGFRFHSPILDALFSPIYPHLYVIAEPIKNFEYSEKRKRELAGYH